MVNGDNQVIPEDTHHIRKGFNILSGQGRVKRSLNPNEDQGQKDHGFNGKTER
jgi:hypothetical protein